MKSNQFHFFVNDAIFKRALKIASPNLRRLREGNGRPGAVSGSSRPNMLDTVDHIILLAISHVVEQR